MNLEPEETIRQELAKAANLISGARRLMAEGRQVDLGAMEERVRAVTHAVTHAPADIAAEYKEHLQTLIQALDVLQHDLEIHHKALQDGLNTIRHRTAQDAYGPKKT